MNRFLRFASFITALLVVGYGLGETSDRADERWLLLLAGAGIMLAVAWWPRGTRSLPIYNRTVLRWATIIVVGFTLVTIQLVRIQVVEGNRIASRSAETADGQVVQNPRERLRALQVQRGSILDRHGQVLADSVQIKDGTFIRRYPNTEAAGLIGYYSPALYGSTNIERAFDQYLSGQKGGNPAEEWLNGVVHADKRGYDVGLSIDINLQAKANELLAGRPGAVVLMDAQTGEVLAMAGAPSFDPNRLYANTGQQSDEEMATIRAYWAELIADPNAPLVFRPTQGLFSPGSTFKTVTASALVDSGKANADTVFRDEGLFEVDGRVVEEPNRPDPTQINFTLEQAYAWSLNVVFAQIGLQLGSDTLLDYAQRFGFGSSLAFDFPTAETQIASSRDELNNRALLADTGFGQGQILATPLQMAVVAATIANDGAAPRPSVVEQVVDPDGNVLERFAHGDGHRVISPESAATMRRLMEASASYGYARGVEIDGATVGGKTGTAEVGEGEPHSWYTGYAISGNRRIAVAVIVEHAGAGSKVALPIGAEMLRAALATPE
ncbi:MAG TPA: penicillin-binding protein 2 [Thermomicrobiales bacterium]|jgi:peptidoglycan glycosyltransferase|nr:penicillin-binding protein 2 [Chloroflexota bacterium]HCG30979.1 penicillin-binding protein 2 [Chloroflexota bacterium]HQZ88875.1 penicillin-binding protein 2 [Thermomicrobiales bacterium]HRA31328.1 penicillin-binding protein 2 [Thermomicrobiales bacterium]